MRPTTNFPFEFTAYKSQNYFWILVWNINNPDVLLTMITFSSVTDQLCGGRDINISLTLLALTRNTANSPITANESDHSKRPISVDSNEETVVIN